MTQLGRDLVSEHEHPGTEGGLGPSSNPAIGPFFRHRSGLLFGPPGSGAAPC